MRAIWKGVVSFGLVSIGVRLYSATEEKDIRFHQVHRTDGGRVRYKRVCSLDGEEVPYDDIAKGYDLGDGEIIILTDEDFADLPLTTTRAIDVLEFVPAGQVDPIMYSRSYYLEPQGTGVKPYLLLRDALVDSDRVAIVKVALRQREQLAALRAKDGVLVLHTMLWPDEIRTADFDFLGEDVTVRPAELEMASSLIDSMTAEFDPTEYTDEYRTSLQQVIEAKIHGREIVAPPVPAETPAAAVDLMAALRASVEKARASRGEPARAAGDGKAAGTRGATRAAGRATTKKAPAGKATAKAAGGKPAARKAAERDGTGRGAATKKSASKSTGRKATGRTAGEAPAKRTRKSA